MRPWRKCRHTDGTHCLIGAKSPDYCAGHSLTCGRYDPLVRQGLKPHNELKEKARQRLLDLGFKDEEIRMEYQVTLPVTVRIDVVALRDGSSVAVECGAVHDLDRIKLLRRRFDKVLVIR